MQHLKLEASQPFLLRYALTVDLRRARRTYIKTELLDAGITELRLTYDSDDGLTWPDGIMAEFAFSSLRHSGPTPPLRIWNLTAGTHDDSAARAHVADINLKALLKTVSISDCIDESSAYAYAWLVANGGGETILSHGFDLYWMDRVLEPAINDAVRAYEGFDGHAGPGFLARLLRKLRWY